MKVPYEEAKERLEIFAAILAEDSSLKNAIETACEALEKLIGEKE